VQVVTEVEHSEHGGVHGAQVDPERRYPATQLRHDAIPLQLTQGVTQDEQMSSKVLKYVPAEHEMQVFDPVR
jgi:hypothetical protein